MMYVSQDSSQSDRGLEKIKHAMNKKGAFNHDLQLNLRCHLALYELKKGTDLGLTNTSPPQAAVSIPAAATAAACVGAPMDASDSVGGGGGVAAAAGTASSPTRLVFGGETTTSF
jgi:hypothetical protein